MLIYVIPLILLIVVLLVVKKRQDAQGSDKPKATAAKSKKTASSARTTPPKTRVVEEVAPKPQEVVPLSADLRKKIERLISEANFFAAEAQINQALKKDNRQHELYLLLLDIHIQQKDEFAISQLLNHVRSLGLDEILAQAEAKKEAFEKSLTLKDDVIDFPSAQPSSTTPSTEVPPASNTTAFEELSPTHTPSSDLSFDELQLESQTQKPVVEPAPVQNEIQPLEFNFEPTLTSSTKEAKEEQPASTGLEFNFSETPAASEPAPVAAPEPTAPTLDFSFDLDTAEKTEVEPAAPAMEFNLDLGTTEQAEPAPVSEAVEPLDFSFTIDSNIATQTPEAASAAPAFDLSSLTTAESATTPAEIATPEFKLDTAPEKPASSAISFDIPSAPTASANQDDPLVQSFPELSEVDEIVLNLDLAQQYIQLGAYDAAREILAEKEVDYTPQQRTQVDQLLNQIAS
ncbi:MULTISPECIES: hypothetical protein [Acinetobacter]|uniref:hypothetical protein n=1 Tax=Acinetobacter TaxID=469 RepID=UPI000537AE12|nr:hypothetical protein [Acinetobacter sp. HR7]KGT48521.1 hypothetical protein GW12_04130 [Acinetobacter sp. HR7]